MELYKEKPQPVALPPKRNPCRILAACSLDVRIALALSSMEDTPKFSADGRQLTKGLFPPAENPRKKG